MKGKISLQHVKDELNRKLPIWYPMILYKYTLKKNSENEDTNTFANE